MFMENLCNGLKFTVDKRQFQYEQPQTPEDKFKVNVF